MSSFTYKPIKQTLREEIKYVTRDGTAKYLFTKNLMDGCEGEKGLDYASQCMAIERIYEKVPKKGETRCYDFILAPDPADAPDPEKVLLFAGDVANEYFRNYQVVAAVHTDTESPHAHIVVNAINLLTGNKLDMSDAVFFRMRQWVDELGERRYGFSKWDVNRNSDNSYSKAEREQLKKNNITGPRWDLRRSVLTSKGRAVSEDDFFRLMKIDGVDVESSKDGRDYVYRMPAYINRQTGKPIGIRGSTLGRLYTKDCVLTAIAERVSRPEKFPGDLSEESAPNPAETIFPGTKEEFSEDTYHEDAESVRKGTEEERFSDVCDEPAMADGQTQAAPEEEAGHVWWDAVTPPDEVYFDDDEYEGAEEDVYFDAYGDPVTSYGETHAAPEEETRHAWGDADTPPDEVYLDDDEYEDAEEDVFFDAYGDPVTSYGETHAASEDDVRYARWDADTPPDDAYFDDDEDAYIDDDEDWYEDTEEEVFSDVYGESAMTDGQGRATAEYDSWEFDILPDGIYDEEDEDVLGDTEEGILSDMPGGFAEPDASALVSAVKKIIPDGEKEPLPGDERRTNPEVAEKGTPKRESLDESARSRSRSEENSIKSGKPADPEPAAARAEITPDEGRRAEDGAYREDVLPKKRVSEEDGAYRERDDFSDDEYAEETESTMGNILSGVKGLVSKGLERARGLTKKLFAKGAKETPREEKKHSPVKVPVRGGAATAAVAGEKHSPAEDTAAKKPVSGTRDASVREEEAPALRDVSADAKASDDAATKADAEREEKEFSERVRALTVRFRPDRPLRSIREFNYYTVLDIWADYAWHELECGHTVLYTIDYMNAVDALLKENGGSVEKLRERIRFNPPEEYIPFRTAAQKEDCDEMLTRLHGGMDLHTYMDSVTRPIYAEKHRQEARREEAEARQKREQNYKDGK